ncbi:MAG: hypothetical protein R3C41_22175 [Calditrichia bacterium]
MSPVRRAKKGVYHCRGRGTPPGSRQRIAEIIEEPPQNLKLILVTANLHKLLPTIKSRCQMLRFSPMGETQIAAIVRRFVPKVDERDLAAIIRLSGFNMKRTFEFLDKMRFKTAIWRSIFCEKRFLSTNRRN